MRKHHSFWSFPYVCPEPVLVKSSFLYMNGSKRPFFHLPGGGASPTSGCIKRLLAAAAAAAAVRGRFVLLELQPLRQGLVALLPRNHRWCVTTRITTEANAAATAAAAIAGAAAAECCVCKQPVTECVVPFVRGLVQRSVPLLVRQRQIEPCPRHTIRLHSELGDI